MFENIVTSKPFPAFVLIQDEHSARALNLFKGILKRDIQDEGIKEVCLVCSENPPEIYLNEFDSKKLIIHDLFRDPCDWISNNSIGYDTVFSKILSSGEPKSTIMIDSVNTIISMKDLSYLCNTIHNLKQQFMRVVCLIHGDGIHDVDLCKIIFFSNVSVKVHLNVPTKLPSSKRDYLAIEGSYKKPSGKIIAIKEVYKMDPNYSIHSEMYDENKKQESGNDVKHMMKGLTTFSLGLDIKENEKIARDSLILPYLRTANKNAHEGEKGEGRILYYAESGDDLEEDPDDDLDI